MHVKDNTETARDNAQGFAQNQLWCEIVALACELLAWTQMIALTGRPPLGTETAPAAPVLRRRAPRPRRPPPAALRLAARWPWASEITAAVTRLQALPSG